MIQVVIMYKDGEQGLYLNMQRRHIHEKSSLPLYVFFNSKISIG